MQTFPGIPSSNNRVKRSEHILSSDVVGWPRQLVPLPASTRPQNGRRYQGVIASFAEFRHKDAFFSKERL